CVIGPAQRMAGGVERVKMPVRRADIDHTVRFEGGRRRVAVDEVAPAYRRACGGRQRPRSRPPGVEGAASNRRRRYPEARLDQSASADAFRAYSLVRLSAW